MAASQDECVAQFPRQPCCNDRIYSRLISWAGYISALSLPPTDTPPDEGWVQQRILADRVPANGYQYVTTVSPYLLETPDITARIREHLNAWNDEATETSLAADIDSGLAVVMPKFAAATVSEQDLDNWLERNGYPLPPSAP